MRGYQASRDHGNADSGGIEDSLAGGVGVSQEKILASVRRTDSFCSPDGRDMRHEERKGDGITASIAQRYLAH
jgi:hypothetical protein